jgi:hypothetical protein
MPFSACAGVTMAAAPIPDTNNNRQAKASRGRACDIVFLPDILWMLQHPYDELRHEVFLQSRRIYIYSSLKDIAVR